MRRRAMLALLAATVAGCTLIDQRTFDPGAGRAPPRAEAPPPPAPAPAVRGGPQPLVGIPLDPPVDYDVPLHDAIAAALARSRRDFDVRTSVPATGSADAQSSSMQTASLVAARVARLIAAQGGRTVLSAEPAPDQAKAAVLVFVR